MNNLIILYIEITIYFYAMLNTYEFYELKKVKSESSNRKSLQIQSLVRYDNR